jgi:DNA-binding transcriptional regulator YdaS (Cro superfamily)
VLKVLERAAEMVGNISILAEMIGAPRSALYTWQKVPASYCIPIYLATRGEIELPEIRDDLYPEGINLPPLSYRRLARKWQKEQRASA